MPTRRTAQPNGHRQTATVRGRRALNAFRLEENDPVDDAAGMEDESLEQSDEGQVKSEDDEDIDSDEAFDESDEERFSTFKFSGSSAKNVKVFFQGKKVANVSGRFDLHCQAQRRRKMIPKKKKKMVIMMKMMKTRTWIYQKC
jgi:hypothetical protein